MRDDRRVDVHRSMASWCGDEFLLRRGDHRVQIFRFVLEHLDELSDAAVADVERAVEVKRSSVAFGESIELRDVDRTDENRCVLVVRIDRRPPTGCTAVVSRAASRCDWNGP